MRLAVRKSSCSLCGEPYGEMWLVWNSNDKISYASRSWRSAVDYAYAATQPGTGVQVHTEEKEEEHERSVH